MHYLDNLLLNTDSYKASHWLQYPPGTDASFFYVESRGGVYDQTAFFGLQSILKEAINRPVTHADIDDAKALLAAHGEPFNEAGWRDIVDRLGGQLPIRIRAVPEGFVVPTHNVLMTIESTDAKAFWVPSYLETLLLRVWYPVTVATVSWQVKQIVRDFLQHTSDDPEGQLPFKLHDFGARGVSSLGHTAQQQRDSVFEQPGGTVAPQPLCHGGTCGSAAIGAQHRTDHTSRCAEHPLPRLQANRPAAQRTAQQPGQELHRHLAAGRVGKLVGDQLTQRQQRDDPGGVAPAQPAQRRPGQLHVAQGRGPTEQGGRQHRAQPGHHTQQPRSRKKVHATTPREISGMPRRCEPGSDTAAIAASIGSPGALPRG